MRSIVPTRASGALVLFLLAGGCGEPAKAPPETPSAPDSDPGSDTPQPAEQTEEVQEEAAPDAGATKEFDDEMLRKVLMAQKMRPRLDAARQLELCREKQQQRQEARDDVQNGRPPRIRTGDVEIGGPPWRAMIVGDRMCIGLPNQKGVSPHWDFTLYIGSLTHRLWKEPVLECVKDALDANLAAEGRFELRVAGNAEGVLLEVWVQNAQGVPEAISECWIQAVRQGDTLPKPTYMPFVSGVVPILLLPAPGGASR
jgi:hypothetical protein